MTNSKSNSNGRFFEYLISNYIQHHYAVTLSERASADQARDQKKLQDIDANNLKIMEAALPKITSWIEKKIQLDKSTTYDRLPDKDKKRSGAGHSDIELRRKKEILGISLKFNHSAVFHGRPYTLPISCGFTKGSQEEIEFDGLQMQECEKLRGAIKPGTLFAEGGIKPNFIKPWKKFMENIVSNQVQFLNKYANDQSINSTLFNAIIGGGSQKYRLILDVNKKELHVEDLTKLNLPTSFKAEWEQKGVEYQYFLKIIFNNGLILRARHKHDVTVMTNHGVQVSIKPDWRVADWGNSKMVREVIKLNL
jgi:hypothetical protein